MKRMLLLGAIMLPLLFSGCKSDFKEQKFMGINGSPKSIKDTKHEVAEKFGEIIEQNIVEVLFYEFDKLGQVQKMAHYDNNGDAIFTITNIFENGKCIESKSFQRYNNITTTNTLKDRTSKNEVWENKSTSGTVATTSIVFGSLESIIIVKDSVGNAISKVEQKIDGKGNIIEYKVYNNDKVIYWYKSTYNDKSQEKERKILAGDDDGIYTYQYASFDKHDNWTKKVEYKNGEIESLTIRKIEY